MSITTLGGIRSTRRGNEMRPQATLSAPIKGVYVYSGTTTVRPNGVF